jgi:flagellar hook protein FlgE
MSLMTSMNSGVSGLDQSSTDLTVIGDNIANANTVGFKGARAVFESALAQSVLSGNSAGEVGLGARLLAVQKMMTQGALTNTGNATDLAINGSGFFVVKGTHGGIQGQYYTRAGQFTLDTNGYLTNIEGLRVQGYLADDQGVVQPGLGDLPIGNLAAPPQPTANITVKANLQSDAPIITAAFDPADPGQTSNFSSSTTVYDSLGKAHQVDLYYAKTAAGQWSFHALCDGGGLAGGTAGTPMEIATGTLQFDSSGRLTDVTQASTFNPLDAVGPQALNFNFGTAIAAGGTGVDGITQFASPSTVTFVNQDGFSAGTLSALKVDTSGDIAGTFSNGRSRVVGRVAVADFSAPDKLSRSGGNLYQEVPESGQPAIGNPSEGGRGALVSGALEQSNVDLASEFVKMIGAQRSFEANSKTITTADQLLSELISIKR